MSNGRAKQVKTETKVKEPKSANKSKSTSKKDTKVKKEKTTVKKESKATSTKVKEESKTQSDSQASVKSETPEEDQGYKWWEVNQEEEGDGYIKWQTLEHNGVMFPPYEPLPSHVKLYYNNKPVNLPPEAEEVAGFYGAMLETDHAKTQFSKRIFQ